ncbi:MAG: hypothetical protein QOH43_4883, partial [Solirubrobacteraceae bacterium]|nr:hypothetical protein [Solirubrobacteraceae bacterium]
GKGEVVGVQAHPPRCPGRIPSTTPSCWIYEPGASMGEAHAQPVDHFSYVIEGTVVVEIDDEHYELTAGDTVYVRAGRRFRVRNENEGVARLLGCGHHVPARPATR